MNTIQAIVCVEYLAQGTVQGVGFRPFVYRLARELGVGGWIRNDTRGAVIHAVGTVETLHRFEEQLKATLPPPARITQLSVLSTQSGLPIEAFRILDSDDAGRRTASISPDLATCPDCLNEIFDPTNRRYLYPFTNCTHCGPRFSILLRIPYDRANTTMQSFTMCARCQAEYDDPNHRRFHAQPNACPQCGPQIEWWNTGGEIISSGVEAMHAAIEALRAGHIVALKGLGGFHLIVDARNDEAVRELRRRKHREEKPLAVMMPSLNMARSYCDISPLEQSLLTSAAAPIVLLRKSSTSAQISDAVAPGNPYLGVMLPYTPLHHLLMRELECPVVATSGNLSDEPICIDEHEALIRLNGIADHFMVHNRPIARHVDDSVVRVVSGREMIVRRSRGYAPNPVSIPQAASTRAILAVGAHMKNTVALSIGEQAFISQHIGDLETAPAREAFHEAVDTLRGLYEGSPDLVACDMHPDYASTKYAARMSPSPLFVQHHHAHIASCLVENGLSSPVLGIAWDGTGYGSDGAIWGGEFMIADLQGFDRVAHLRYFPLPGGDQAIREPRRAALGLLFAMMGHDLFERKDLLVHFTPAECAVLLQVLERRLGCPLTSSMGRLFDAVSSLISLRHKTSFEGQAAMDLEFSLPTNSISESYKFTLCEDLVDWEPAVRAILKDVSTGTPSSIISARFHNGLVDVIAGVAQRTAIRHVVLSGGCFQNAYLLERSVKRLKDDGFEPVWHRHVPPNDGGISLGQLAIATHQP